MDSCLSGREEASSILVASANCMSGAAWKVSTGVSPGRLLARKGIGTLSSRSRICNGTAGSNPVTARCWSVAQLAEQWPFKPEVVGSLPIGPTMEGNAKAANGA